LNEKIFDILRKKKARPVKKRKMQGRALTRKKNNGISKKIKGNFHLAKKKELRQKERGW
jgi:hypothetical protein